MSLVGAEARIRRLDGRRTQWITAAQRLHPEVILAAESSRTSTSTESVTLSIIVEYNNEYRVKRL